MNIIFFSHPQFLGSQSMPRFAQMLMEGMSERGHKVKLLTPQPLFFNLKVPNSVRKWMGYLDQYLLFPIEVRRFLKSLPNDTLFVFTDHALGPWIPLISNRPHVIHCHDFLAQRSALGEISENRTNWTGKKYQAYIHRGYSQGKNFISVSEKTRIDLHNFLTKPANVSEVVYNGLNQSFVLQDPLLSRAELSQVVGLDLTDGYLLHVGGNQWYKNRAGVVEIYDAWRSISKQNLPLLMIGKDPDLKLKTAYSISPYKQQIHFLSGLTDESVRKAYAGASLFLFPSLAEGFGWPIAEAMASGCPVVTTNEAPMTEVAGEAAFLISRRPNFNTDAISWAIDAAYIVEGILSLSPFDRNVIIKRGLVNAKRFNTNFALDRIEAIYKQVLNKETAV